jgi:hypothetical protein
MCAPKELTVKLNHTKRLHVMLVDIVQMLTRKQPQYLLTSATRDFTAKLTITSLLQEALGREMIQMMRMMTYS